MRTIKEIPRVKNMESPRTGNPVANQYVIVLSDKFGWQEVFQSYDTIIAIKYHNEDGSNPIVLDEGSWDYSTTTGKYRNEFLGEGIAETRKKIASGEYKLEDLN